MIKVTCSECGKTLKASGDASGKKVKCPNCGHVFIIGRSAAGKAGRSTRSLARDNSATPTQREPHPASDDEVANPERALEQFQVEAAMIGIAYVVMGIILLPALILIGVGCHLLSEVEQWMWGLNVVAVSCWLGSPFAAAWVVVIGIRKSRAFLGEAPKRATAEETVRTLLQAIENRRWKFAYNTLTDVAQRDGIVTVPKVERTPGLLTDDTDDGYSLLRHIKPNTRIKSLKFFKRVWLRMSRVGSPSIDDIEIESLDEGSADVVVPWITQTCGADGYVEKHLEARFRAVEVGEYWFLSNPFFCLRETDS